MPGPFAGGGGTPTANQRDDDILPPPEPSLPAFAVNYDSHPDGPLVALTLADLLANERGAKGQTDDPLGDRPDLRLL